MRRVICFLVLAALSLGPAPAVAQNQKGAKNQTSQQAKQELDAAKDKLKDANQDLNKAEKDAEKAESAHQSALGKSRRPAKQRLPNTGRS